MRLYFQQAGWTGSACSVYLEGTRSHNEGRVSTLTCYLLLYLASVRLSDHGIASISGTAHAQFAEGLHFSAFHYYKYA